MWTSLIFVLRDRVNTWGRATLSSAGDTQLTRPLVERADTGRNQAKLVVSTMRPATLVTEDEVVSSASFHTLEERCRVLLQWFARLPACFGKRLA